VEKSLEEKSDGWYLPFVQPLWEFGPSRLLFDCRITAVKGNRARKRGFMHHKCIKTTLVAGSTAVLLMQAAASALPGYNIYPIGQGPSS
jgi:hypothetical protein